MMGRLAVLGVIAVTFWGCRLRDDAKYERFAHDACAAFKTRQEAFVREFNLNAWERYDWDQDKGTLVFSHQGVPKVIAQIQFVGSYSHVSRTWRWAWANDATDTKLKVGVARVRALGEQEGWRRLTEPQWPATEQDGWDMTSIAGHVLGAQGAYKSPDPKTVVFMVITAARWATEPIAAQ
jgi:hypothetical protein